MAKHIHIETSEKELRIISKILKVLLALIQSFLKKKYVHKEFDLEKEMNDGKEETK